MSVQENIKSCEGGVSSLKCRHFTGVFANNTSSSYSFSSPQRPCDVGGFDFLTPLPVDLHKYLYQQKFRYQEKAILSLIMLKGLWFKQHHCFDADRKTIQSIAKHLNISEPTLRRHIAQLKAINLIKKKDKKFFLCSTEKLMKFLGCNTEKHKIFNNGIARFKTAYIPLKTFSQNPQKAVEDTYLKRLESQQLYIIRKKVNKVLKTCNVNTKRKKAFTKATSVSMVDYIIDPKKYPHVSNYHKLLLPNDIINITANIQKQVVISCDKMAKTFNRKATQTGANRLKRCLIQRTRRLKHTGVKFNNRNELFNFRMANKGHFVGFKGVIFESLTSSFTSLVDEISYCSKAELNYLVLSNSKK